MLREARDELAARARALADAKNRKGLERMGLTERRAGEILGGQPFTSEDMADLLGVALPTLRNWMAPADKKVHREMPETAKRLLGYILRDQPQAGCKQSVRPYRRPYQAVPAMSLMSLFKHLAKPNP
jgi:hypothetical protein